MGWQLLIFRPTQFYILQKVLLGIGRGAVRERELFLLFIVYSIVPLFVSLLLIVTKMTTFIVVPMHVLGLFPNMLQVLAIIFPWVLFAMNAHIYFVKKIQGQGMPKMFLGVTIIQGLFSLIALLLLLSIVFF